MLLRPFCLERRPVVRLFFNVALQPLNFPRSKAWKYWHSVDAHVKDIVATLSEARSPERWPVVPIWVDVGAQHLDCLRCTARNHRCSNDSQCYNTVAMVLQAFRLRKAADSLIMCWCHRAAHGLSKTQGQKSLTLHWHSVLAHSSSVLGTFLARKAADRSIMGWCRWTTHGTWKMQGQKAVTLHRYSFFESGQECVISFFGYNADQCMYICTSWQCSIMILECVRWRIVDAPMTRIFRMQQWGSYLPIWL